jgi:hypothetical protein
MINEPKDLDRVRALDDTSTVAGSVRVLGPFVRIIASLMTSPRRAAATTVVVYLLIAIWMMRRLLIGELTFFGCCDASLQTIAWLNKVAAAARHLTISLWDFSVFSGTSFAGEVQPAPFYPITIMLGLLGFRGVALAYAFVFLHFVISLMSMHFFLRNIGASRPAATVGATSFTFGGYVALQASAQANIYAGLVLLPLAACFYHRACLADRMGRAIALAGGGGIVGAAQIAAGHLMPFIYSSYALGIYGLVLSVARRQGNWRRPMLVLLISQISAVAFVAVPIFLSLEYLMRAYRWNRIGTTVWPHNVSPDTWLGDPTALHWHDFSTLLSPHNQISGYYATLFFTITGLAIVPITLLRLRSLTCWLWLLLVFSLVVALGSDLGPAAYVVYHLPLVAQTRTPARALYLYNFATAALTAIAIDRVRNAIKPRSTLVADGVGLILVLLIIYEISSFSSQIGIAATDFQEPHRFYFHNPALSSVETLSNSGPLVDRFVVVPGKREGVILPPNAGDLRPILNVLGYRATMLRSLFDFISRDWSFATSQSFDELGVRWVLSEKPLEGMRLTDRGDKYFIYERPVRLSVLWAETGNIRQRASVERVRWQTNRVTFWLSSQKTAQRLVFAQPTYPGWQAFVDGKRAALQQEDIFMAVDVSAEARKIEFVYRPKVLAPLGLTGLALLFWFAAIAWDRTLTIQSRRSMRPTLYKQFSLSRKLSASV